MVLCIGCQYALQLMYSSFKLILSYIEKGKTMEEYNHGYFQEALSNFTKDFAYGGAIRHLVDHGYTVDRIIKEFNYPLSRETIEKMVNRYLEEKNNLK